MNATIVRSLTSNWQATVDTEKINTKLPSKFTKYHQHSSVMSSHLSMVVGWHLSHRASQLGHLHLPLVIPLEATEQHLPLAWFQTWHTHNSRHTLDYSHTYCKRQCFLRVTNLFSVIIIVSRTVHQAGDWPLVVRVGEKYQLLVDKVIVGERLGGLTIQVVLRRDRKR